MYVYKLLIKFLLLLFRLTITASCPMNLQYFPMDRQLCHIEIESCKYLDNDFYLCVYREKKNVYIKKNIN